MDDYKKALQDVLIAASSRTRGIPLRSIIQKTRERIDLAYRTGLPDGSDRQKYEKALLTMFNQEARAKVLRGKEVPMTLHYPISPKAEIYILGRKLRSMIPEKSELIDRLLAEMWRLNYGRRDKKPISMKRLNRYFSWVWDEWQRADMKKNRLLQLYLMLADTSRLSDSMWRRFILADIEQMKEEFSDDEGLMTTLKNIEEPLRKTLP